MKILIVASTILEIKPLLKIESEKSNNSRYFDLAHTKHDVSAIITGVGIPAMCTLLSTHLTNKKYDLVINAGIAGAYQGKHQIGDIVGISSEIFGDLGAEGNNATFLDLFSLGLCEENEFPFVDRKLICNSNFYDRLHVTKTNGVTVNLTSGTQDTIDQRATRFDPGIETMESGAFFYVCLFNRQPFLALRAISNIVQIRDRESWQVDRAITELNKKLVEILLKL